jgi:tRNA1(Val) A37 N6-methylase TrmN6
VAVHVIYSSAQENISAAQIQSQISVLNKDYHKTNSDITKTPGAFAPLEADM